MRIASFLPSATEMLFALGAGAEVCATTFECDFPPAAADCPHVVHSHLPHGLTPAEIDRIVSAEGAQGRSLYFVDLPQLASLEPGLIVLQDLCRVCAIDSPTLARDMSLLPSSPRILSLNAHSVEEVFAEIELLGEAAGRVSQAAALTVSLRARVEAVRQAADALDRPRPRVLALEWLDPLFQGGHWIPEMIALAGGEPVLATAREKSVRISWQQVAEAEPEVLIIMPCGYHLADTVAQFEETFLQRFADHPRNEAARLFAALPAVQRGAVYAVDGSAYFSRPGPRLADGLEILGCILSAARTGEEPATGSLPHGSVQRLGMEPMVVTQ